VFPCIFKAPLTITGLAENSYRGSEIQLSEDGRVLYATVRYRERKSDDGDDDRATAKYVTRDTSTVLSQDFLTPVNRTFPGAKKVYSRQAGTNGILTAVLLSEGRPGSFSGGYPIQMLMQASTPTSGGRSNVVKVAPWNNGVFALSDSDRGFVQIWRLDGISGLPPDTVHVPLPALNINWKPQGPPSNIRASIVGEWRAPTSAVGNKAYPNDDDLPDEIIPSGRGCCSNAIWYD
jgi:hypothetical protein